jgi:hypothetical protein
VATLAQSSQTPGWPCTLSLALPPLVALTIVPDCC